MKKKLTAKQLRVKEDVKKLEAIIEEGKKPKVLKENSKPKPSQLIEMSITQPAEVDPNEIDKIMNNPVIIETMPKLEPGIEVDPPIVRIEQRAEMLEVRFSDNMIYRIPVNFIYQHYLKNTKSKKMMSINDFVLNNIALDYVMANMSWHECSMVAMAVSIETLPDYEKEFKDLHNIRIITQK